MKNLPTYGEFLNEGSKKPTAADVDDFISTVLKLGSKSNLFDTYMKRKGLDQDELSVFVWWVADRIKSKWS